MAKKKAKKKTRTKSATQAGGLTELQQRFVNHYLVTLNAGESARRAGVRGKSYYQLGHQMLNEKKVQAVINKFREEEFKHVKHVFRRMAEDLIYIATDDFIYSDITDIVHWDEEDIIRLESYGNLTPSQRRAIKSIKQVMSKDGDRGVAVEMKDYSQKMQAIKMLCDLFGFKKHLGKLEEDAAAKARPSAESEHNRMDRLLANARLYEERAGQKGPIDS